MQIKLTDEREQQAAHNARNLRLRLATLIKASLPQLPEGWAWRSDRKGWCAHQVANGTHTVRMSYGKIVIPSGGCDPAIVSSVIMVNQWAEDS